MIWLASTSDLHIAVTRNSFPMLLTYTDISGLFSLRVFIFFVYRFTHFGCLLSVLVPRIARAEPETKSNPRFSLKINSLQCKRFWQKAKFRPISRYSIVLFLVHVGLIMHHRSALLLSRISQMASERCARNTEKLCCAPLIAICLLVNKLDMPFHRPRQRKIDCSMLVAVIGGR